jgi:hypothetical protein
MKIARLIAAGFLIAIGTTAVAGENLDSLTSSFRSDLLKSGLSKPQAEEIIFLGYVVMIDRVCGPKKNPWRLEKRMQMARKLKIENSVLRKKSRQFGLLLAKFVRGEGEPTDAFCANVAALRK